MFDHKSKTAFFSAVLGTIYSLYLVIYFSGAMTGTEGTEQVGAAIATALVTPHMVLVCVATILNWVGYFGNKVWALLTAGILYAVGGVIFMIYFFFVVPMIILSFVAVSKVSRLNKEEAPEIVR